MKSVERTVRRPGRFPSTSRRSTGMRCGSSSVLRRPGLVTIAGAPVKNGHRGARAADRGSVRRRPSLTCGLRRPAPQRSPSCSRTTSRPRVSIGRRWISPVTERPDRAVAAANPRTVVVLNNRWRGVECRGSPKVAAVVEAWYPVRGRAPRNWRRARPTLILGPPADHVSDLDCSRADRPVRVAGRQRVVTLADGLDIGYRWYQTVHVHPLFPFGLRPLVHDIALSQ